MRKTTTSPLAKLTPRQVHQVLIRCKTESQSQLARRYKVSQSTIWNVINGKNYRKVKPPVKPPKAAGQ